jgi:predicted secreted Zn-dependent protease
MATRASKVSVDYYSINGDSTAALDREIRNKGPRLDGGRHAVAVARIKMVPDVRFAHGENGCLVNSAKVHVDAKVTLPRWTGRNKASKDLGEAWDNIDRYTRLHEATHVAIAFRHAKQLETRLLELEASANCQQQRAKSQDVIAELLETHDKRQKDFDADEQRRFSKFLDNNN